MLALAGIVMFMLGGVAVTVGDSMFEPGRQAGARSGEAGAAVWTPGDRSLPLDPLMAQVASESLPVVVQIEAFQPSRERFGPDHFERFFLPGEGAGDGDAPGDHTRIGSGIIVREDGYIATARSLLRDASELIVTLHDGARYPAALIGADPASGVAVVKIDAAGLPVATFEQEAELKVGQWVMAVGSPLSKHFMNTLTAGVLSTLGRTADDQATLRYLRTDAALASGSTGGGLFNLRGRVAGMAYVPESLIATSTGVSYALPPGLVERVADELIARGPQRPAWLGITYGHATHDRAVALSVVDVVAGSAAEKASIRPGDVIVGIDGEPLETSSALANRVAAGVPGDTLRLDLVRAGARHAATVMLEAPPPATPHHDPDDQTGLIAQEMGFTVEDLSPELIRDMEIPVSSGVVVLHVDPASTAYRDSDVRGGMVIVEMAGQQVRDMDDFVRIYAQIPDDVFFLVIHYTPLDSAPRMTALIKPCRTC